MAKNKDFGGARRSGRLRGRHRQGRRPLAAVAAIGHELREPMNGVLGMARLLADTPLSDEQQGFVAAITESAEALLTVINDLLDLSRAEAGRLDLLEIDFDPRLLLERILAPFWQKATAKNLRLELTVDPAVPARLRGDPGRLRQILVNLVGNAVKFTDAGSIAVRMTRRPDPKGGRIIIQVADTGPGFDAGSAARLFAGHVQAGATTRRVFGGSGLGLMVALRLVRAMGGQLGIDAALGQGACFSVDLPLAAAVAGTASPTQPVRLAGLDLLVVEARPELRDRLRKAALSWGLGVRGAAGGSDALREIQEARTRGVRFDLAILSATLAEAEAAMLLGALRAAAGPAVRALCLADSGLRGDAARARSVGFDGYLAAPFADDDLKRILLQLVQPMEESGFWTRHQIDDQAGSALRILVADDNPVNARLAALLLGKAGHAVTTVEDGAAAVSMVESGGFDLVLMDVQMPRMDGLTATRRIRALADPGLQKIPVVALTAEALAGDEAAVRAAGMDAFLTKPIDRPKLLSTVQFWGGRGRRRSGPLLSCKG